MLGYTMSFSLEFKQKYASFWSTKKIIKNMKKKIMILFGKLKILTISCKQLQATVLGHMSTYKIHYSH